MSEIETNEPKKTKNFHPGTLRWQWHDIPLFLILRSIPNINDASKIFRAHLLESLDSVPKGHWIDEILERYVRIFKPLAADAPELKIKLSRKYHYPERYIKLPEPHESIGLLFVREKNYPVIATGFSKFHHTKFDSIIYSARQRAIKTNEKSFLNKKLTAEQRKLYILVTELKAYITAEKQPWKVKII